MAVAKTGNNYTGTGESGTITSVTVPEDADIAIVIGAAYLSGGVDYSVLNFDGSGNDFTELKGVHANGYEDCRSWYQISPATGTGKTLTYSWDSTPYQGYALTLLFFLSGVDTGSPIIATPTSTTTAGAWTSGDIGNVGAADMAIIAAGDYGGAVDSDYGAGQAIIYEGNHSAAYLGVGSELNEDTPSINSAANFMGGIAFGIKAEAVGGTEYDEAIEGILPAMAGDIARSFTGTRPIEGAIPFAGESLRKYIAKRFLSNMD